ncbi:helix-turn-helix domain-containing protein [Clostridium beijerinckii]|jgi:Predicted transcriptional regulator|uniref:helix-turn-helix domain-containing protein n=1 Tax=Clostridium beijerinckii TaxID=1520 RepID=UPI0013615842|nr:helix-turn-helix transcriptional regulator [Clostridium beijerinckii]MZK53144.1 helix-turn-helix domain-containing protein [Clostridium beijerinckii]MZK61218.1 helix-turn-helix domain-containing protein [Clostridium beijerinckii]MZK71417.1 helix-turn-helix domain-containing protein [Clostridium beijerinckii]MZK76811.1 helix-turn-helix domain-containing protein [Clostridium beijerinckii]MZK86484.1 helix-turn-helix domain-containing protein [Clostridium beijerinckii]
MATFSERLKELRIEQNITLDKLSEILETTKATLSRYENNLREPRAEFVEKCANHFNVSVDYILGRTDIKSSPNDKSNMNDIKLTKKDEKDIEKSLTQTLDLLQNSQDGLMFDGEPIDDLTRELLANSLKNSMEIAKKLAKEKYTPKKYRK